MARFITPQDIEHFVKLRKDGLTHREIAERTGWSEDRVSVYLRKAGVVDAPKYDRAKVLEAYRGAKPQANDEHKHLKDLYEANGYGFSWWPPSLMERVYLLERSPAAGRPFWNAA